VASLGACSTLSSTVITGNNDGTKQEPTLTQRTDLAGSANVPSLMSTAGNPASSQALNPVWANQPILPHKRKTNYQAVFIDGVAAIKADADRSASALQTAVNVDPTETPFLTFSWRADQFADDVDVSDRTLEDSPVRIMIAFEGDVATLEPREQLLSDQARLLTGRPLPYATLMYVWSNAQALEAVVTNPHTKRVKKIVLSNKQSAKGQWHKFKRNVVADYERAFGKKPGRIKAIAIMTDSDNTGDRAIAYYKVSAVAFLSCIE
jgi:hypothetical protein